VGPAQCRPIDLLASCDFNWFCQEFLREVEPGLDGRRFQVFLQVLLTLPILIEGKIRFWKPGAM
jgi:hypothetical protein